MDSMEEKNLPDKVDELLTEVVNKAPLTLAAISTIPYFGGTIATFFSAKWLQVYQQRTEALFQHFGEHLDNLDERVINKDYFDTEEGIDLLIKATEQSNKTGSEEKRDLISRILAGAPLAEAEGGNYSPEEYLNIVASLTPKELEVARTIYDLQRNIASPLKLDSANKVELWRLCAESIREKHAIEADDLPLFLNRITATGLTTLVYEIYASGDAVPTYWVAPSFDRLIEFLSLNS